MIGGDACVRLISWFLSPCGFSRCVWVHMGTLWKRIYKFYPAQSGSFVESTVHDATRLRDLNLLGFTGRPHASLWSSQVAKRTITTTLRPIDVKNVVIHWPCLECCPWYESSWPMWTWAGVIWFGTGVVLDTIVTGNVVKSFDDTGQLLRTVLLSPAKEWLKDWRTFFLVMCVCLSL